MSAAVVDMSPCVRPPVTRPRGGRYAASRARRAVHFRSRVVIRGGLQCETFASRKAAEQGHDASLPGRRLRRIGRQALWVRRTMQVRGAPTTTEIRDQRYGIREPGLLRGEQRLLVAQLHLLRL